MRKFACILLSLLLLLSACSGGKTPGKEGNPYYNAQTGFVDLTALKGDMISRLSIADPLDLDKDALLSQYGIQPEDVAEAACFVTLDGAFPQEIIMVRAADGEAAGRVEEHLQTRLEEFRVQSRDYDAENYAIAQKCNIHRTDVYVAMFLTPDYEELAGMFQDAMQ